MTLGSLLFFFVTFLVHLALYPPSQLTTDQLLNSREPSTLIRSKTARRPPNRMTVSILMAVLGTFVGAGFSRGHAFNVQRRRDLNNLIAQGKKQ